MNFIRPYCIAALALLASSLTGGPADACCHGGTPKPSIPSVRPSTPTVSVPNVHVNTNVTRGPMDSIRRPGDIPTRSGGSKGKGKGDATASRGSQPGTSSGGSKTSTPGSKGATPPARTEDVYVVTNEKGEPLKTEDGKPATLVVIRHRNDLTPTAQEAVLVVEQQKYDNDEVSKYELVNPNDKPSRNMDCGGHGAVETFKIKPGVVTADGFYKGVIVPGKPPEVMRVKAPPDPSYGDWPKPDFSQTQKGDVGIMFKEDGKTPGHVFVVHDPATGTIRSKDGNERMREGQLVPLDGVHNNYKGDIVVYRINPGSIKVTQKK